MNDRAWKLTFGWNLIALAGLAAISFAVVLGAFATAGQASPGRTAIDVGQNFAGDGKRYVAYLRPDHVPVVFDTFRRKTRLISDADGCRPTAVGGGRVLLDCNDFYDYDRPQTARPRTASVRGGGSVPVPGFGKTDQFDEIGRFWLRGESRCEDQCELNVLYRDWRTGRSKSFNSSNDRNPNVDKRTLDLNTRGLKPFQPPFEPDLRYGPSDYGSTTCYNRRVVVADYRGKLLLFRSPDRSRTIGGGGILSFECAPWQGVTIGSGRVTWTKGRTVHAVDIGTLRRYERKLNLNGGAIKPVRGGVVIAQPTFKGKKVARYRIRLVRLP